MISITTPSSPSSRPDPHKILIVEDNLLFRGALKERLEARFPSAIIDEAGDGSEALRKVDILFPEIVFMDIRLPGQGGLQLTRRIKRDYPDIRVVILTDYDLPEYREAAIQYGASWFIAKAEVNFEEVAALVKSTCPDLS
jgi:DNA-binding NarL/FixJ family response regulator